jgi:hypothetical protein
MPETQENYTIDLDKPFEPSPYPALGFEVQEHHANLVISLGPGTFFVQSVTAEQMNAICHQWLSRHGKEKH